jgi:hypothetical protein
MLKKRRELACLGVVLEFWLLDCDFDVFGEFNQVKDVDG